MPPKSAAPPMAVYDNREDESAPLDFLVELRPGWVKMDYQYRGDHPQLKKMNVMEYLGAVEDSEPQNPTSPPLNNCRFYLDMDAFAGIMQKDSKQVDAQTTLEMREMPEGMYPRRWLRQNFQLNQCGLCGDRDASKLTRCSGCRSFMYCCKEHQMEHWQQKHKHVCLKRKEW